MKRSKNSFEALMAYFHIDRAQRYIQRLGFGTGAAKGINKRTPGRGRRTRSGSDNSFYSPGYPEDRVRQRGAWTTPRTPT